MMIIYIAGLQNVSDDLLEIQSFRERNDEAYHESQECGQNKQGGIAF